MKRILSAAAILGGVFALGCSSMDVDRPALDGSPIVLERESYVLEASNGWLQTVIRFTFTNVSNRQVSLLNCNGAYSVRLERWDGQGWALAWSPVLPACLSPPIVIEPGASREDNVNVSAGQPSTNNFPRFVVDPIDGLYRFVIDAAYWDYDHSGPPWGVQLPLEYRVSHPFELRSK